MEDLDLGGGAERFFLLQKFHFSLFTVTSKMKIEIIEKKHQTSSVIV